MSKAYLEKSSIVPSTAYLYHLYGIFHFPDTICCGNWKKTYMYILKSSEILHVVEIADGFLVGGTVTMSTQIIIIG